MLIAALAMATRAQPASAAVVAERSFPHLYPRAPATTTDIIFNHTISDMSPLLAYSAGGWTASIDNSTGASAHTATVGNSFFTFSFTGTGVYIFGQTRDPAVAGSIAAPAAYLLSGFAAPVQKNITAADADSLLVFVDGLRFGSYTVNFYTITGTVSLSNIKVRTQLNNTEAPTFDSVKTTEALLNVDNRPNTAIVNNQMYPELVGSAASIASQADLQVLKGRTGYSFVYPLPANSSYVVLNGITQPKTAVYSVNLTPSPPGGATLPLSGDANQGFTEQTEFFGSALDPLETYNLTFTVGNAADQVGVRSIVTYSSLWTNDTVTNPGVSSSASSSRGTNTATDTGPSASATTSSAPQKSGGSSIVGPVVGGVVGGVAALLLIALAVFLFLRRKKKDVPQARQAPDEAFVIDEDTQAQPYPYEMTQQELARNRMSAFSDASTTPLTDPVPYPPTARDGIQGFVPNPASPTLTATTATTTNMLGFGVVNGDTREVLTTNSRDPAMVSYNIASQKRAAALRAQQDPFHPPQERDAGRWNEQADDAVAAMNTVPPSYDPSWAGDYSDADLLTTAGTVVDEPLNSAGPSARDRQRDSLLSNDSGARRDTLHEDILEELAEEADKLGDKLDVAATGSATVRPISPADVIAAAEHAQKNDDNNDITTTKPAA